MRSSLYRGEVFHNRLRPRAHRLRYRVFWLLLDLEELDDLDRRLRLFSHNGFNLMAVHDRDHGDGSHVPLRSQVKRLLADAGVEIGEAAIRLLTMPRVLGFVFNPISIYYCHRPDGALAATIYEVTSTFGERHAYVLPVDPADVEQGLIWQGCRKRLYVSPFMGMDMRYVFRSRVPDDRLTLGIDGLDDEGKLISTGMRGRREGLSDRSLISVALAMPLLTLKVVFAIHWEALLLWVKGVALTKRMTDSDQQPEGGSGTVRPTISA